MSDDSYLRFGSVPTTSACFLPARGDTMSADVDAIRRQAIKAGEHVYSKMEYDDPDESPLGVALRVAVDEAMSALAQRHAGGVSVDVLKHAVGCWHPDTCEGPIGKPTCAPCRLARNRIVDSP